MCPVKYICVCSDSPPWITQEIIEAVYDRTLLFKIACKENTNINVINACRLRHRVNKLINGSKATYIKDILENNKDNPKKCWRILNDTLLKGENRPANITLKKGNDTFTTTDESCDFMNNYLADIGVNLHDQFNARSSMTVYEDIYNCEGMHNDIIFPSNNVVKILNNIDVHKSSGIDFLPTFVLKDCFMVLTDQLVYIYIYIYIYIYMVNSHEYGTNPEN